MAPISMALPCRFCTLFFPSAPSPQWHHSISFSNSPSLSLEYQITSPHCQFLIPAESLGVLTLIHSTFLNVSITIACLYSELWKYSGVTATPLFSFSKLPLLLSQVHLPLEKWHTSLSHLPSSWSPPYTIHKTIKASQDIEPRMKLHRILAKDMFIFAHVNK